jgi:hypothetical protein
MEGRGHLVRTKLRMLSFNVILGIAIKPKVGKNVLKAAMFLFDILRTVTLIKAEYLSKTYLHTSVLDHKLNGARLFSLTE